MDFSQDVYNSDSVHMVGAVTRSLSVPIGSKIVHIDFLQSGTASNTWVECGGMQVARNFARDAEVDISFTSTTTCQAVKTGNDESFVTVVWSTAPESFEITVATSTDLTSDGIMSLYAFGIMIFISLLFFMRGIFNINRYD